LVFIPCPYKQKSLNIEIETVLSTAQVTERKDGYSILFSVEMASSGHRVNEIRIQFNSLHCGQCLSAVQNALPAPCHILGLIRDNKVIVMAENPTLLDQDVLIVLSLDSSLMPLLKVHPKKAKSSPWRTHATCWVNWMNFPHQLELLHLNE